MIEVLPALKATGYGLSAVSFLLLALLLGTVWRGRAPNLSLVVAVAANGAWSLVLALGPDPTSTPSVVLCELVRNGAWLWLLASQPGRAPERGWASYLSRDRLFPAILLLLALIIAAAGITSAYAFGSAAASAMIFAPLFLTLAIIVILEQHYRNAHPDQRTGARYLVIGVGGIFAYDLFLYSYAVLLNGFDPVLWSARGFANVLLLPALVIAVRHHGWAEKAFVSRHIVFYSTGIITVGLYMLLMALAGYYLRLSNATFGPALQLVFLLFAAVVLGFIVFSDSIRARLLVLLTKHFYRNKYDYRDEWLRLVRTLAESSDVPLHRRCIQAVAQILGAPDGALYLRDAHGGRYDAASSWNKPLPDHSVGENHPLVRVLATQQWIIDTSELAPRSKAYRDLELRGDDAAHLGDSIIVPLQWEQALLGFIAVRRPRELESLNFEDFDLLRTAGYQIASFIAQEEASAQLAANKQFEAFNQLTAFIVHDLKNLVAQQSLVVANAKKFGDNPAFVKDAMLTIQNSVERMNKLLAALKRPQPDARTITNLTERCAEMVDRWRSTGGPAVELAAADEPLIVSIDPDGLENAVYNLAKNAREASPPDGRVVLELGREPGWAVIRVRDFGHGMDSDFLRSRLFTPFHTTKGSQGMGIGVYQVRQFAESSGGSLEAQSKPGQGTTFTLRIPLAESARRGHAARVRKEPTADIGASSESPVD